MCTAPHDVCMAGMKLMTPFASEINVVDELEMIFGVAGLHSPSDGVQVEGPRLAITSSETATGTPAA